MNNSFLSLVSEVNKKLTKGLLKQREKISKQMSIDVNYVSVLKVFQVLNWEDIIFRFKSKVIDHELLQKSDRYRTAWFKDVWNVESEFFLLLFVKKADIRTADLY
jgi:hypothetical protein